MTTSNTSITNPTVVVVTVTSAQFANIQKPVNGTGGYQGALKALQGVTTEKLWSGGNVKLFITPAVASRLMSKSIVKAAGGYGSRLAPVTAALVATRRALNPNVGRPASK